MSDRSVAISSLSFPPAAARGPTPNRTVAARTRLLLEGPVLSALLRLSAQISTDGQIGDCNVAREATEPQALHPASNRAAQSVEKSKPVLTNKGDSKCAINLHHFTAVPGR
jgi:hypothetical protein